MGAVGLLFSGAALFINSLMLLGKAEAKSAAIFNLLTGALQVFTPIYLILTSDQSHWSYFNNGAIFLFGFTYLYLGIILLKGYDGSGLGWYSLWVAMIALVYAGVYGFHFHDAVNAVIWVMWAYLWFLFFLLNSLQKPLEHYIGKVGLVQSFVTLTIPSLLMLTGIWGTPAVSKIMLYVSLASILFFAGCTIQAWGASKRVKEQSATLGAFSKEPLEN